MACICTELAVSGNLHPAPPAKSGPLPMQETQFPCPRLDKCEVQLTLWDQGEAAAYPCLVSFLSLSCFLHLLACLPWKQFPNQPLPHGFHLRDCSWELKTPTTSFKVLNAFYSYIFTAKSPLDLLQSDLLPPSEGADI